MPQDDLTNFILMLAGIFTWLFSMITLSLFYDEVFYEPDPSHHGWMRPKNKENIIMFCWILAPLTLIALWIWSICKASYNHLVH